MIKRIVSIALVAALVVSLSCNFAVKNPAATAGIVAGSVALTTCELASENHKSCFIAAGAVGAGLWLLASIALWLGTEDEPATTSEPPPKVDWSQVPDTTPKEPTKAPPPPPTPDAGVPEAPPPVDAGPALPDAT